MTKSRYDIGVDNLNKIIGNVANDTRAMLNGDFSDVEKYILEFVFGDIYHRPGLSLKEKEMITLSTLIAQGASEGQIKVHMLSALNLGVKKEEIIELIIQCIPNVGFPKVLDAVSTAKKVFIQK